MPYAAIGEGPPLIVIAGISPTTGVEGDQSVRMTLAPFAPQLVKHPYDLDDMATTIEAEDTFDLSDCPTIRARTFILADAQDRFYSRALP